MYLFQNYMFSFLVAAAAAAVVAAAALAAATAAASNVEKQETDDRGKIVIQIEMKEAALKMKKESNLKTRCV